jgi:hypothetical protein
MTRPSSNDAYSLLLHNYRCGRMNSQQLQLHMEADHGFRAYVREFEKSHANAWRL